MLKIKNNLLKFSSFFNLYVYCNQNQVVNGEEVNYFFPRFGDIQEVFVLVRNFDIVKDNLILMKCRYIPKFLNFVLLIHKNQFHSHQILDMYLLLNIHYNYSLYLQIHNLQ